MRGKRTLALLELINLGKQFDQGALTVRALNAVSLTVHQGEFVALVGPSGSGKTTLLNMIGALDVPSEGKILLDGVDIAQVNASELAQFRLHKLGFVFQAYNLVPVLSAKENVELVLMLQGRSRKACSDQAETFLELVGLKGMIDRRPSELSGGQQQRVAVARALASEPRLVLADEPTANLDSENAEALLTLMHQLCKEKGVTFLFSTHDPRVMARAERIITLRDGRVESDEKKV